MSAVENGTRRAPPSTVKILGEKIKGIREEKGLTQLYVASVVGVTTDTISRWENGRSPSIKGENAIRLAQALEVDPEDITILEEPTPHRDEAEKRKTSLATAKRRGKMGYLLLTTLLLLAAVLFSFWHRGKPPVPTPQPPGPSASRWLPDHAPAGAVVPVVITITFQVPDDRSLVVKETLPSDACVTAAWPRAGVTTGRIQWIIHTEEGRGKVAYLARFTPTREVRQERVKGMILDRGGRQTEVGGDEILRSAPFHWADRDKNGVIDDLEILEVYDLLEDIPIMQGLKAEVEEIWAAPGYRWSPESVSYMTLDSGG